MRIRGLTLIEVLIALAILAIALIAVIKATAQTIRSTSYLQDKAIATFVAENALNEAQVGVLKIAREDQGKTLRKTNMLGRDWYWQFNEEETGNHHIKKMMVTVFAERNAEGIDDPHPLVNLESYRYHQTD